MTYRELLDGLMLLSDEQLQCDVTVELEYADECYPVDSFRICGDEHPCLDEDHPVLFVIEATDECERFC